MKRHNMKKNIKITKTMTLEQILDKDPNVAPILLGFGLHCLGCPMSRMESIEDASAVHGIDADLLVEKLNEYFSGKK